MPHIEEIVRKAKEKAYQETDSEPDPSLTTAIQWPVTCEIGPGLEDAITCESKVGYVNGPKGWLIYCGLDTFDLSQKSSFEETAYLLLYGKLPTLKEFEDFKAKLSKYRALPSEIEPYLERLPIRENHAMTGLRTLVSILGMLDPDADDTSVEAQTEVVIKMIARFPTVVGAISRIRAGEKPLAPDPSQSLAADFIRMMTGKQPSPDDARVMDICLILHADHGINASTFASMVVNSSMSDMYSSLVAGIGSLKGPLHGGANEAVLHTLEEIGDPAKVDGWYEESRAKKRKVMGFGHRVYKAYDPRARVLHPLAELLSQRDPEIRKLYDIAEKLEKLVVGDLGAKKGVFPNVDFYSGIVYAAMGIDKAMFTPIFAVSRVTGWGARTIEYLKNNRIFRPQDVYVGPLRVEYVPIQERG
ncbi:MAG: citrate synthase/methylcitrate synthase [Candidatus Omnitrophica bacterium]|nr:Citrate synthase [bacterium]NUN97831.1 citrate synthase/methylcitrate synthase [Candidatus Omnitrophota bacterium]